MKNYFLPQSLDEALGLLADHGDSLLVMAGGTVAMPLMNEGVSTPENVMGLRQAGLSYVNQTNGQVAIGATTTLTQMALEAPLPMLKEAARQTAAWAIRNLATVGGNLFVPPPAGDFATALLALDARLVIASQAGRRTVPLADFYTGFMSNLLAPNELLVEIQVPMPQGQTAFLKFGRKQANTPSVVTVAAHVLLAGSVVQQARIALNAVGPYPFRASAAETELTSKALVPETIAAAAAAAAEQSQPFTDAVASDWYRRKMVRVFVDRALSQIAGQEG